MKKIFAILLALVLALGCASAMAEYKFTTGGSTGTYYAYGTVLAQYISDNAWVHGLIVENDNVVYNSDLIADIAWDNYSNLAPGGFTYK